MTRKMKTLKMLAVTLIGMLIVAFLGCSGMIDGILPCMIEQDVLDYVEIEKGNRLLPWTTIADAEYVTTNEP